MRLLFGHDVEVADWVARHIPHAASRVAEVPSGGVFGPCAAIGVLSDAGKLVAGTVFHAYAPHYGCIEVSCAATHPTWARPDLVRTILRYPFSQLGCQRITACTPRRATSVRRFLERLGFKREGSIRRGFGNDNCIVYGLLAEDWAAHAIHKRADRLTDGKVSPSRSASPGSDSRLEGAI